MILAVPLKRIAVGVVVECRRSTSRWADFIWRPIGVLPGEPSAAPWTVLSAESERTTFYAGRADIALYRTETAQYRDNLTSRMPSLWIALRPTGVDPAFEILAVTADPAEGEAFTQAGDDLVEAVAMPAVVRDIVEAFVAEHHIERPFEKRQRTPAFPSPASGGGRGTESLARRSRISKD